MERKKKFFRNNTIVKRILCFVFAFTLVVTMGAFSNLNGTVIKADEGGNTLTVHFKNALEWETVYVLIASTSGWENISGLEDYNKDCGVEISEDEENEGWYTHTVTLPDDITVVCGLFNNGSWDDEEKGVIGNQTPDYSIDISGDTEVWMVAVPKDDDHPSLPADSAAPGGWVVKDEGGDVDGDDDNDSKEYGKLINGSLAANTNGWTVTWTGTMAEHPNDTSYGNTYHADSAYQFYTEDINEESTITISQTVEYVASGHYQAGVAVVGNGQKGASESDNVLWMTVKNITANTEKTVQLVTDGWDNWDNVVKTDVLEANEGNDLEITISGTLTGADWYGLRNVTLVNVDDDSNDDDNNNDSDDNNDGDEDEEDTAVDAPITVEKVKGLSEDFIHGVDLSTHLSQLQSGVKYYDENGDEADLFDILEEAGVNYVRLRVWNCPFRLDENGDYTYVEADGKTEHSASEVVDETGIQNEVGFKEYYLADGTTVYRKSYGGGICDVDTAAVIGKMATEHGMKVLIDFHYSDFWADPNKRSVPKEWDGLELEAKGEALYQFTKESLETLLDAGVNVGMVQIGNEMNNGLSGEKTYDNVHALLKRGSQAVREVSAQKGHEILIAVHFTNPNEDTTQLNRAWELDQAEVDYDVFGTSYYPYWHGDAAKALTENLGEIAKTYNKKVMVCEVAYLWTTEDGDGYGNMAGGSDSDKTYKYPISVEGQATAIRDTIAAVAAIGENGIGTFYWEPAWVPVNGSKYDPSAENAADIFAENVRKWKVYGSGWASIYANDYDYEIRDEENGGSWDNQTLFDFNGKALPSLNVYKYVYTGANGPTTVSKVDEATYEMQYGEEPKLPQTVTVNLNNGTTVSAPVTWDAEQTAALKTADFGEHAVSGTVGAFSYYDEKEGKTVEVAAGTWKATCNVKITGHNYVFNGGFEEGEADNKESHAAGWKLTVYGDMNESPRAEPGAENAKSGDWFYQGWQDKAEAILDFAIDQDIARDDLPDGSYMLFAYYQGTGVDETLPQATLYAVLTYKDGTSKTLSAPIEFHNVWKDYYQAKVRDIIIDDSVASVQIGTRLACSWAGSGSWVTVDDISLMKMKDLEPEYIEKPGNTEKPDDKPDTVIPGNNNSGYDGWAGVSAEQKAKLMQESLAQNAAVAAPKTNDNAPVAIVLMLLMAGAVAVAGAVAKKRRLC